jgi:hypothetical protein
LLAVVNTKVQQSAQTDTWCEPQHHLEVIS